MTAGPQTAPLMPQITASSTNDLSHPAVGFRRPALSCVAAGLKTLDLRHGNPLAIGTTYMGHQGAYRTRFRVNEARPFATVEEAWQYVVAIGRSSHLIPDVWLRHAQRITNPTQEHKQIRSASQAATFYATHCRGRKPSGLPVTLYEISVVKEDKTSHQYLLSYIQQQLIDGDDDRLVDVVPGNHNITNEPYPDPNSRGPTATSHATPIDQAIEEEPSAKVGLYHTVSLLMCQVRNNVTHVLCIRDANGKTAPPTIRLQCEGQQETKAAATVIAQTTLQDPREVCQSIAQGTATHTTVDLLHRRVTAYATHISTLPLRADKAEWVWIPGNQTDLCNDEANRMIYRKALTAWATTRHNHRKGKPGADDIKNECTTASRSRVRVRKPNRKLHKRRTRTADIPDIIQQIDDIRGALESPEFPLQLGRNASTLKRLAKKELEQIPFKPATVSTKLKNEPPPQHTIMAAIMIAYCDVADQPCEEGVNQEILTKLIKDSKIRAASRGSKTVTPQDLQEAAKNMTIRKNIATSPADVLPEHYNHILDSLSELRTQTQHAAEAGNRRPRVLVACERHAVVAKLFREAGADVATCDIHPTDTPGIPHYQGDANLILDQDWDLIIGHPPCTYLANVGVSALVHDVDGARTEGLNHSGDLFRRFLRANAPYIAVENPTMHKAGRLRIEEENPTQYVQPYQHGTPHQKRTGLHLVNLPPLVPTCEVEGRERPMANLPQTPERSDLRSRTYVGIAGAMAMQWMPVLLEYIQRQPKVKVAKPTASETVKQVQESQMLQASKVWFTQTKANGSRWVYSHIRKDSKPNRPQYDTFGGKRDQGETSSKCALREMDEEMYSPRWRQAAALMIRKYPSGYHRCTVKRHSRSTKGLLQLHDLSLWSVELSRKEASGIPYLTQEGENETTRDSQAWRPMEEVVSNLLTIMPAIGVALKAMFAGTPDAQVIIPPSKIAMIASMTPMPKTMVPWLHPPAHTRRESLPTPVVRKLYRRYGTWQAWGMKPGSDPPQCQWTKVPPLLNEALTMEYPMSPIQEEIGVNDLKKMATSVGEISSQTIAFVANMARPSEPSKWVNDVPINEHATALHHGIRREWDKSEKVHKSSSRGPLTRLGLGVEAQALPRKMEKLPTNLAEKIEALKKGHATYVPAETEKAHLVANINESAPETHSFDEIAVTPKSVRLDVPSCLHLQGVTVCRRAQTRNREGDHYWVDSAFTDTVRTLPDTGAVPSVVTTGLLAQLPADALVSRHRESATYAVEGPSGSPLTSQGHATIVFDIDGKAYRHKFLVIEGKPLFILGGDFMEPWKAKLELNIDDQGTGQLHLGDRILRVTSNAEDMTSTVAPVSSNIPTPRSVQMDGTTKPDPPIIAHVNLADTTPTPIYHKSELAGLTLEEISQQQLTVVEGAYTLYSEEAIPLPPMTKRLVFVKAPHELKGKEVNGMVKPLPHDMDPFGKHPLVETVTVTPDEHHMIPVVVINNTRFLKTVPGFSPIASYDTECVVHTANPTNLNNGGNVVKYNDLTIEQKAIIDKVRIDPQNRLSIEQVMTVKDLLAEFVDIFSVDPKNPKHTHLMSVSLDLLPDVKAHRHAPSKLGPEGQKIVDKHVDEMESRNIIRKSNSAWGSRVVLVTKKDGSIRFCVDYRDTNSKLHIQDSPIPLTAEAIDRLASGQGDPSSLFLSTMDLASGFWCLPIDEKDKPITAFVTHRGKYEFNYLPFGIQSGPSYMCRLMDATLEGLAWDVCMPYLDDTAIWSTGTGDTPEAREGESYEQMLVRLRQVFRRFRAAQLSCKPEKCEMFATSAEYLGHVVSRRGLEMDPKKIKAISEMDTTAINEVGRVRSFLGLASYYRRFIRDFARIAAPLHDLTKDGVDVATISQSTECQASMRELIVALTSEPVLVLPRFDREFIVKTDAASTEGIGGVLSQVDDDNKERVNAYYGRRLKKAERQWTVTEVELLAALESISNWRPYL